MNAEPQSSASSRAGIPEAPIASATNRGLRRAIRLEQAADLQVVAQVARVRRDLDDLDRQPQQTPKRRAQRRRLAEVVVGNDELGGPELPEQRRSALLDRFDLEVNPRASGTHRGRKDGHLIGERAPQHAACARQPTRGDSLRGMQAHEHLIEAGIRIG